MYYIYMLRCTDNSIYTGITNDLENRMNAHFNKLPVGAKYTHSHTAEKLEIVWETENKSLASKLEYRIKHLSKYNKENLICCKDLSKYFEEVLDLDQYALTKF